MPSSSNTLIQPYLFFGGRCEEALEFYRKAVGAEVEMMMRYKESPEPSGMPECFQDKIMHASVRIGGTSLMASDGSCEGPSTFEGFSLSITVPDEAEAERVFNALSADGGLVTHAAREDILGAEVRHAPGQVRRRLDGVRDAQAVTRLVIPADTSDRAARVQRSRPARLPVARRAASVEPFHPPLLRFGMFRRAARRGATR